MQAPGHLPALPGSGQVDDRDRDDDMEEAPGISKSHPRLKSPTSCKSHTRKRAILSLQAQGREKPVPCPEVHTKEGIKKHGSAKYGSAEEEPLFV